MADDASYDRALGALLAGAPGVIGAVLGSTDGARHAVHGNVRDGSACAATIAVIAHELDSLAGLLQLGQLEAASVKTPSAARLLARVVDAVVTVEVDARRPLGELETRLRSRRWAATEPPELATPPAPVPALALDDVQRHPAMPAPVAAALIPPVRGTAHRRPASPPPQPPRSANRPERPTRRTLVGTQDDPARVALSDPQAAAGTNPVFTGDLGELGLPSLLEFLRHGQRTGTLVCTTPSGIGTVRLQRGLVTAADSPRALDLRQLLLALPRLTPDHRRAIAELPAHQLRDAHVDETLGSSELVSADEVHEARIARIYSAFREMTTWTSGRFAFTPEQMADPPASSRPMLSAQAILLQLFQEHDENAR